MKIEPRIPNIAFDFGQATTAWFNTSGGKDYALRLWFWHSMSVFILLIVTLPLIVPMMGEYLEAAWLINRATLEGGTADPAPLFAIMLKLIPGYVLFVVGLMLVSSLGEAAFYRKYLTGAEPARIPIRIDRHTGRNMLVQLGFYLLYLAVYTIGLFVVVIVGGLLSAIFAPLGIIVMVVGVLFVFVSLIAYPVYFAPSAALSALCEKPRLLATRGITRHRFWPLFGAFLVTYIGGYIAYYIIYILLITLLVGDANAMVAFSGLSQENPRAVFDAAAARFSNPLVMIMAVLGLAVLSAAWSAWMLWIAGVSAYAVRWWQSDDPKAVFD